VPFIFKIINGNIIIYNFPKILEEIGWLVLTIYTRSKITFYDSFHTQNLMVLIILKFVGTYMIWVCHGLDSFYFNYECKSKLRRLYEI